MDPIKIRLIEKAKKEHRDIFPTAPLKEFDNDSFTTYGNRIHFWFNTKDNSTKMVVEHITEPQGVSDTPPTSPTDPAS